MRLNSAIGAGILAVLAVLATSCGRLSEEVLQNSPSMQNRIETKSNSGTSAKESLMGAPMTRGLGMKISGYTTILLGRRISFKDTPRKELVANITGSNSDPNFVGAFNHEKICYDREIVVEVEKYLFIAKVHYPALFNEDRKRVTLRCEVYDQLEFDVPEEKRTKKLIREAYDKQVKVHAEQMSAESKIPQEKASVYLAHLGPAGPEQEEAGPEQTEKPVPYFEELTEGETMKDIRNAMERFPAGTFIEPK